MLVESTKKRHFDKLSYSFQIFGSVFLLKKKTHTDEETNNNQKNTVLRCVEQVKQHVGVPWRRQSRLHPLNTHHIAWIVREFEEANQTFYSLKYTL